MWRRCGDQNGGWIRRIRRIRRKKSAMSHKKGTSGTSGTQCLHQPCQPFDSVWSSTRQSLIVFWSIRWTNALRTIDLNRGWYYSIMNHPVLIRTVSVKKIDTTFSITFSTLFDFTWFYSYIFWTLLSKPSEIVGSSQLLRSLIGSRSSTTANV